MIVHLLLVLLLLLLVIDYSFRFTRFGRLVCKIPSAPPLPIIGHAYLLFNDGEYLWNLACNSMTKYYPIIHWRYPGNTFIGIWDPDDCKTLLADIDNITKAHFYMYFKTMLPDSFFIAPADAWNLRRKLLTPAFHPSMLKNFVQVTQEQGELFVKTLLAKGNESIQELIPLASKLTFNIICESMTGIDASTLESDVEDFINAVKDYLDVVVYRMARPYISDWMLQFLSINKKQNDSTLIMRNFATQLVNRRKKNLKLQSQTFNEATNHVNKNKYMIEKSSKVMLMMDLLIEAENQSLVNEQDVISETVFMLFAGYDTTAIALTYFLMLLAENEEIQNKARSEALDVMNRCQGKMTINNIQSLEYIDRCLKESLRLYPSVCTLGRKITKDLQLKNYLLPAGVEIMVPIFMINRDPNYWIDPEKFDPDRWLPENLKNHHPYSFITFSAGPRICMGQKFGMFKLKLLIAQILCNFYIEPVTLLKDVKFEMHVMLSSKTPLYIKFKKIKAK